MAKGFSRRTWTRIFSIAFSIALAAVLISVGDVKTYLGTLARADLQPVIAALLIIPIGQTLRAIRLRIVVRDMRISLATLYYVSSLHMLFSSLVPVRAGEASLPLLLRRHSGHNLVEGVGILAIIRVYDLLLLTGTACILALFLPATSFIGLNGATGAVIGTILLATTFFAPRMVTLIQRPMAHLTRRWPRLQDMLARLCEAACSLSFTQSVKITMITAAIWTVMSFMCFLAASAVLPSLTVAIGLFASPAGIIAGSQPFNGVAGMGTFEAATASCLVMAGFPWEEGLTAAVVIHATQIVGVIANAGLACLLLKPPKCTEAPG